MYIYDTNNNRCDLLTLHIRPVRTFMTRTITGMFYWPIPYFSYIIQMDNTDDRAESLCRRHRELNRLRIERETPEEAELRRACGTQQT